jgi:hypothetical protein
MMKKITLLFALLTFAFTNGQTTSSPVYEGTFNGTVYSQTSNFPTGAEGYAGFSNNNLEIYPLAFTNGGKIKFKATVTADAEVYFRFEANAYPAVDPAYNTANVSLLASNAASTEYEVAIPATADTYNSAIFYIVTRDVDVAMSEIKIEAYDTDGATLISKDFPVYDGTFNGTIYSQTFNFPTGAESYAGFANNNTKIYPLAFASEGKVKFKATVTADAEVYFRFEANAYPNVDPSYNTAKVTLLASNAANTEYEVAIPATTDTYNSTILYVVTRDVVVSMSEIKIIGSGGSTAETCSDGIQNQDETGIDCGGTSCDACLNPPTTAPTAPPVRNAGDVISIYSDAYTSKGLTNVSWDDGDASEVTIANNKVLKMEVGNFLGQNIGSAVDAADMTHFHMDYYVSDDFKEGQVFNSKLSNHEKADGTGGESNALVFDIALTAADVQTWKSLDVALPAGDKGNILQFLITVSNTVGLAYLDNIYLYKEASAGIENNILLGFSMYPNPAANSLNISAKEAIQNATIYNVLGKKVMSLNINKSSESIDISNLTSGIYFLKYNVNDKVGTAKFIKQ